LRGMILSRCVDPPRSDLRLSLGGCLRFKTFELNFTTPIEDRMMEDLHDLRLNRAHQVCSFEHYLYITYVQKISQILPNVYLL